MQAVQIPATVRKWSAGRSWATTSLDVFLNGNHHYLNNSNYTSYNDLIMSNPLNPSLEIFVDKIKKNLDKHPLIIWSPGIITCINETNIELDTLKLIIAIHYNKKITLKMQ